MKFLKYSGTIGVVIYWLFVFWSIFHNDWFDFLEYPLSALGTFYATYNSVYNFGVCLTAALFFLFSIYLIYSSKNKLQTIGGAYISISSLFLLFIGLFPDGTKQHNFVAVYFFFQFFLGMAVFGIGSESKFRRYFFPTVFALAFLLTPLSWPSMAVLETYELSLILILTLSVAIKG